MDENIPLNQQTSRLSGTSHTGSNTGDSLSEQSDQAENILNQNGERGDQYKQEARRQRLIAQRMRILSEGDSTNQIRNPRNAKFQRQEGVKKTKLDNADVGLLLGVAIFFDFAGGLISLIDFLAPPLGELINGVTVFPAATYTLYLMYKRRGIEFKEGKALVRFWGTLLIGFIPIIAVIPEYSLNVILTTIATRAEEKIKKAL